MSEQRYDEHGQPRSHYEMWREYAVTDVSTIEEFLSRYYKPDRSREPDGTLRRSLLESHKADLKEYGVDWISHHDSMTGRVVAFYPGRAN